MDIELQRASLYRDENDNMDESFHTAEDDSDNERQRVCLYIAAMKGNWETAISLDPEVLTSRITSYEETALHVAAIAKKGEFVEKLVDHVNGDATFLKRENRSGNTALCYAATTGDVSIARIMLEVNEPNEQGYYGLANLGTVKPLSMAALLGRCEMVRYLLSITDLREWAHGTALTDLFTNCIRFGLCAEALDMLRRFPQLATQRNGNGETGLSMLARNPLFFSPETQPAWRTFLTGFCTRNKNNKVSEVVDELVRELHSLIKNSSDLDSEDINLGFVKPLLAAAEVGNDELIIKLIRIDPDLLRIYDDDLGTIFHNAARHRRERIFTLLYDDNLGSIKDLVANQAVSGKRNILHLAAELAPSVQLNVVSGAALQMRREILWFKEVERIVKPSDKCMRNSENKTPRMVFDKTHKDLKSAGEKWMKDTSESSIVVAALIATVMFTTAFTVPGGFNNSNGVPVFKTQKWFFIFALADAFALFCSSTSILVFHSIMTSRYTEQDFLVSLPFWLMVGVTSLFASVAAMMVAFSATFLLYYPRENVPWVFPFFALFACVPTLFVSLKCPLLFDLIRSTCDAKSMFKPHKKLFL